MPVPLSETDLIRNGRQAWLWQSSLEQRDQDSAAGQGQPGQAAWLPRRRPRVPLTPQQAASQALKAVGPSTSVSVQRNMSVAGQPAYQLVLSPKAGGSLIGRVTIAMDAAKNVPLRVQVFARGARHARVPGGLHLDLLRQPGGG